MDIRKLPNPEKIIFISDKKIYRHEENGDLTSDNNKLLNIRKIPAQMKADSNFKAEVVAAGNRAIFFKGRTANHTLSVSAYRGFPQVAMSLDSFYYIQSNKVFRNGKCIMQWTPGETFIKATSSGLLICQRNGIQWSLFHYSERANKMTRVELPFRIQQMHANKFSTYADVFAFGWKDNMGKYMFIYDISAGRLILNKTKMDALHTTSLISSRQLASFSEGYANFFEIRDSTLKIRASLEIGLNFKHISRVSPGTDLHGISDGGEYYRIERIWKSI